MVLFQDFIARRHVDLEHERQLTTPERDEFQAPDRSVENDIQVIELLKETIRKNRIECDEKDKAIEQEMREMRAKMERYEKLLK